MEYTEASELVRDPVGPMVDENFDMEQYYQQKFLQEEGLCANDEEAARAHNAVFDAERDIIDLDAKKDKDKRKAIQHELATKLRPEAASYCSRCEVEDVCYQFGVAAVRLSYGVIGGLPGSERKSAAKATNTLQIKTGRVRGRPASLKPAV